MHFGEKFDEENIDRQHLRPPVLATLLETIERENLNRLLSLHQVCQCFPPSKNCAITVNTTNVIELTYVPGCMHGTYM